MAESLFKWKHFESNVIFIENYRFEVIHMIHKGKAGKPDVISEIKLINRLFGIS